jgi:CHAT domain-containing protein
MTSWRNIVLAGVVAIATMEQPEARAQQARDTDSAARALTLEVLRELTALQADLLRATPAPDYERLRNRSLQARTQAASLGRNDMVFAAEAIATSASMSRRKATEDQRKALPLLVQAMSDAGAALEHIQYSSNAASAERFVVNLVSLIDDANTFPFSILREEEKRASLLRQIAVGAEQGIPIDFHFTPRFGVGDETTTVYVAETLAVLSYGYGSSERASRRLSLAAEHAKAMGDPDLWVSILSSRYGGERAAGAAASQTRALRDESRRAANALRAAYGSRAGRIWASYRSDRLYGQMLQDQLSEPGEPPAAIFAAVEALKARTLLDELALPRAAIVSSRQASEAERRAVGFDPLPDVMFEGNQLLRSEASLISQLSTFELPNDSGERLKALGELESLYRQERAGFTDTAMPATLRDIQEALKPHEAILEYVIPFNVADPVPGLWMLLISRDGFVEARSPLDKVTFAECESKMRVIAAGASLDNSPLGCGVINLRIAIQRGDDDVANDILRALHFLLIQPLLSKGVRIEDFDHLIIVPHGPLHYVPFPALRDESGKYLVSKTAVTIAPSASIWRLLTARQGEARHFVGFANPGLEYALKEVEEIETSVRAAGLTASSTREPAKDRFFQAMASANILHIATHGEAPGENAQDYHALRLDANTGSQVAVRASEIQSVNLPANLLTVLSVCDAGLYRTGPGNEPYGLIPAFLKAGAQNVIGTLWQLDDPFGKEFMVEFYRHLWSDGSAEAMRKTSLHFIDQNELIRNWAAFVLMGPGRPFNTSGGR